MKSFPIWSSLRYREEILCLSHRYSVSFIVQAIHLRLWGSYPSLEKKRVHIQPCHLSFCSTFVSAQLSEKSPVWGGGNSSLQCGVKYNVGYAKLNRCYPTSSPGMWVEQHFLQFILKPGSRDGKLSWITSQVNCSARTWLSIFYSLTLALTLIYVFYWHDFLLPNHTHSSPKR